MADSGANTLQVRDSIRSALGSASIKPIVEGFQRKLSGLEVNVLLDGNRVTMSAGANDTSAVDDILVAALFKPLRYDADDEVAQHVPVIRDELNTIRRLILSDTSALSIVSTLLANPGTVDDKSALADLCVTIFSSVNPAISPRTAFPDADLLISMTRALVDAKLGATPAVVQARSVEAPAPIPSPAPTPVSALVPSPEARTLAPEPPRAESVRAAGPTQKSLKERLIEIGIEEEIAAGIAEEIKAHERFHRFIDANVERHGAAIVAIVIYKDHFAWYHPTTTDEQFSRISAAQKIKENTGAMKKYAEVFAKLKNELHLAEEQCYLIIDMLNVRNFTQTEALQNLERLTKAIPSNKMKFLLLTRPSILHNINLLEKTLGEFSTGSVTEQLQSAARSVATSSKLEQKLVETSVDTDYAVRFKANYSDDEHAAISDAIDRLVKRFGAPLVAVAIYRNMDCLASRTVASTERLLEEFDTAAKEVRTNAAALQKYKDIIPVLKEKLSLSEEQAYLIVATLRDNRANETYTRDIIELMHSRLPDDKKGALKEAVLARPSILFKRDLEYAFLRQYPQDGEQISEDPLEALKQKLKYLEVDAETIKEITSIERFSSQSDECVISLMILEQQYGKAITTIAVYKQRDMLITNQEPKMLQKIVEEIDTVGKDNARLTRYANLINLLTSELNLSKEVAYVAIGKCNIREEMILSDLRLLMGRVPRDKLRARIMKSPHSLSSRMQLDALLEEYPSSVSADPAQIIADVLPLVADRLPRAFVEAFVRANLIRVAGKDATIVWRHIDYAARNILARATQRDVSSDFVREQMAKGIVDVDTIVANWGERDGSARARGSAPVAIPAPAAASAVPAASEPTRASTPPLVTASAPVRTPTPAPSVASSAASVIAPTLDFTDDLDIERAASRGRLTSDFNAQLAAAREMLGEQVTADFDTFFQGKWQAGQRDGEAIAIAFLEVDAEPEPAAVAQAEFAARRAGWTSVLPVGEKGEHHLLADVLATTGQEPNTDRGVLSTQISSSLSTFETDRRTMLQAYLSRHYGPKDSAVPVPDDVFETVISSVTFSSKVQEAIRQEGFEPRDIVLMLLSGFRLHSAKAAAASGGMDKSIVTSNLSKAGLNPANALRFLRRVDLLSEKNHTYSVNIRPENEIGKAIFDTMRPVIDKLKGRQTGQVLVEGRA